MTNNLDSTRSQTFTYDQLNRIVSALTTSTHATSPTHCWGEIYTLDAWANLSSIAATTNSAYTGCSQEAGFSRTADTSNRLSGFGYDASGNTIGDGVNSYTWNAESQLKTAAGTTYTYDGAGRRVSKVGSKLYWYGSGGEILAETNASGTTTAEYIFFGGKRIAMLPAGGNPTYYLEDLLGTSRVLTTNIGVVCYDADFYPYGGERAYTNSCPQNYKFEGKERDAETGNDDFGARYYSNHFGRWLSSDWSAVPVAVPYANLTNPQTLNLYSMVADDPESFFDLDGHQGSQPSPAQTSACNVSGNSSDSCLQQQSQAAQTHITIKLVVYYSENLTDAQRAAADGQVAIAQFNAQKIGINLQVSSGGTVDPSKFLSEGGGPKGTMSSLVGTNEDFSGHGSRSNVQDGKALIVLNIAKNGDDSRMFQFEFAQVLTIGQKKNQFTNAVKDTFYTPFLSAGLDGSKKQVKAANILTFGGYSQMRKNAARYQGQPEQ